MGRGMWLLFFSFLFPLSPEASAEDKAMITSQLQFIANTVFPQIIAMGDHYYFLYKKQAVNRGRPLVENNILLPGSSVLNILFYCPIKSEFNDHIKLI